MHSHKLSFLNVEIGNKVIITIYIYNKPHAKGFASMISLCVGCYFPHFKGHTANEEQNRGSNPNIPTSKAEP